MTNDRFNEIKNLLEEYSAGNFNYSAKLSNKMDEIDSITNGIMTLGKELQETAIHREIYSKIYNNVAEMLIILNDDGQIININKSCEEKFNYDVTSNDFNSFCAIKSKTDAFDFIKQSINKKNEKFTGNAEFLLSDKKLFVNLSVTKICTKEQSKYLVIAEDITYKIENQRAIARAIINTEEQERKRVADDLHDSLGQDLSSIKLMLSLVKKKIENPKEAQTISTCISTLEDTIQELRNICFNLMPTSLLKGGLIEAISQVRQKCPIPIQFEHNLNDLRLIKEFEVTFFRIFQEFINNSIKHSNASEINLKIAQGSDFLKIHISDNGSGFEQKTNSVKDGRGLYTMQSRVESLGGEFKLESKLNEGVKLNMVFYDLLTVNHPIV